MNSNMLFYWICLDRCSWKIICSSIVFTIFDLASLCLVVHVFNTWSFENCLYQKMFVLGYSSCAGLAPKKNHWLLHNIFTHIYIYTNIYININIHMYFYIYIHIYCFLFAFQCWFAPSKKISHWYICMWMDSLILANKMRHGKFNFSQWKMAKCSQGVDAPHASIKARHTPNLAQDRPNQAGHGPKRAVLFKPDLIFLRSGS